jgi:hypothetical protein
MTPLEVTVSIRVATGSVAGLCNTVPAAITPVIDGILNLDFVTLVTRKFD